MSKKNTLIIRYKYQKDLQNQVSVNQTKRTEANWIATVEPLANVTGTFMFKGGVAMILSLYR
jgi:hypothetical protein